MNATTYLNEGLLERSRCPHCQSDGKMIARTTIAEVGRWPKFHGPHYRLEQLDLAPDTKFRIRWCSACNLGFSDPLLNEDSLDKLYNQVIVKEQAHQIYARSMNLRQRQVDLILQVLDRYRPRSEPGRLLDFGAGWGLLLREARVRGWEPYGIEPAEAERRGLEAGGIPVYGSLEDAPDEFFDAVGSTQVIEHVANFDQIIQAQVEKLKPGGLLYIDVPNAGRFARRNLALFANPLEHVNYFTRQFFTRWLLQNFCLKLVWPRFMAPPKESWRSLRQRFGLGSLTLVFRKHSGL